MRLQVRSPQWDLCLVLWPLPFSKDFLKFLFYLHLFTFGFLTGFQPILFLLRTLHHFSSLCFSSLFLLPSLFHHFYPHKAYTWVYLHYACPCCSVVTVVPALILTVAIHTCFVLLLWFFIIIVVAVVVMLFWFGVWFLFFLTINRYWLNLQEKTAHYTWQQVHTSYLKPQEIWESKAKSIF